MNELTEIQALVLQALVDSEHGVTLSDFPGSGLTEESLLEVIDSIDALIGTNTQRGRLSIN